MKTVGGIKQKQVTVSSNPKKTIAKSYQWWMAPNDRDLAEQVLATASFLKENQGDRYRQAAIFAKLYGNINLFNLVGSTGKIPQGGQSVPLDRPTFNLIQSAIDTIVAKIGQTRPSPTFLTDGGDYKERRLAKQLNNFIQGELYQTDAYEKAVLVLRDALALGTGVLKIYETDDNKVGIDRILYTELFVDPNEAIYSNPRQIHQLKLIDRQQLMALYPKAKRDIMQAEQSFVNDAESSRTVSDLVMVVESWHLKSGKDAKDGRHVIACSSGVIFDEDYDKEKFPFVFLNYSPRMLGFWAQGVAEQLMGTQLEINSLLYTISKSMKLVGVPRIFVENGSKVVKSHLNNEIGTIITYTGVKPSYEVAQCVPQELYAQLQRLIEYGYKQVGVSEMQAGSQKPGGLNSGEAIRSYSDISSDRMATISKAWEKFFVELSYQIIDKAKEISERTGKYQTIYPNKDGTKEIDLPKMKILDNPFVIQCFNMSSLPRDPAGRMQKVTEMIQSGMITIKEGRRLLDYPDLEQIEKLANSSEERIYKILDQIIEEGEYTPPDEFMDLQLAQDLVVQYYNLYVSCNLEEEKAEQLRTFHTQVMDLLAPPPAPMDMAGGMAPPMEGAPGEAGPQPLAPPEPMAPSPLVPQV